MPTGGLDRLEHGKFGFPIAQHEGFQFGEATNFANAIEPLLAGGLSCGAVVRPCVIRPAWDNPSSLPGNAVTGFRVVLLSSCLVSPPRLRRGRPTPTRA